MKSIDYYISEVENKGLSGGDERTLAYPFVEDGIILVKKYEPDFGTLKIRIKKCKDLGIYIPEYYDYKKTNNDEYWILEELAEGTQFSNLVNENGQNIINNITYEQIEKYIIDSYLLDTNGIGVEPRRRNIFYDNKKGFTTIDVALYDEYMNNNYDSLETTYHFFNMFSRVLLVEFSQDENGQNIKKKTILNMIKAFENGHPFFKKYSRWIYRNNDMYGEVLEKLGVDLTLTKEEDDEIVLLINKLIDEIVVDKVNNPKDLFNNKKTGYIELLSSSINYSQEFNLFDSKEQSLDLYIQDNVYNKIKNLFLSNTNDKNLRELYFNVRRKELDPCSIYPIKIIYDQIDEGIKQNNSKQK